MDADRIQYSLYNLHFNRKKSLSQVGELSNFLINLNPLNRTYEPVFSHIVFGKLKENLFNCDVKEALNETLKETSNTPYARLMSMHVPSSVALRDPDAQCTHGKSIHYSIPTLFQVEVGIIQT